MPPRAKAFGESRHPRPTHSDYAEAYYVNGKLDWHLKFIASLADDPVQQDIARQAYENAKYHLFEKSTAMELDRLCEFAPHDAWDQGYALYEPPPTPEVF